MISKIPRKEGMGNVSTSGICDCLKVNAEGDDVAGGPPDQPQPRSKVPKTPLVSFTFADSILTDRSYRKFY